MLFPAGWTTPGIFGKRAFTRVNVVANRARPALIFAGRQILSVREPSLLRKMHLVAFGTPPLRLRNAAAVRLGRLRANRLFVLNVATRAKPRMRIRNGKPSDDQRRRKPL